MIAVAAQAAAARLGGGGAPDVPVMRIVLAFVLCAAIALLAVLLLRQRIGAGRGTAGWWRGVTPATGAVEVQEVRRLTLHADVGVVRHAGREYLLLVQAGNAVVLRERDVVERKA